ncbi:MAG TPA: phosphatidylinositol mannoside acyltransferase [Acidimicrobiia bacterium]|nr:phosphatidylinositol mannoside acyltransferase [Acidimicrobiia bacterium]
MVAYLAMRVGTGLVGLLPFKVAITLGEWAGRLFGRFGTGRRQMVERHARRLGIPDAALKAHIGDVFAAYGRYWAEALWIRPRRKPFVDARTTDEGLHHLDAARQAGGGAIVALPHMGNWEYAATVGTRLGLEVVAVAENLRNQRIRNWFLEMRDAMDIGIVLATGGSHVIRELEKVLARNGVVALLCDRDIKGKGVLVEFFGERTTMPAGPASLAIRTGAPLMAAATYFDGDGHHVVIRPPIAIPDGGERGGRIQAATQVLAREIEDLIRAAPDQWHLLQPNWPSDREADR